MRSDYAVVIETLSDEDGGGFVATVPDLPGCMSDGATREEAAHNIADAITAWIEEAARLGRPVPAPSAHLLLAGE
jgi:predicted RNase H-like HicB family nuclease